MAILDHVSDPILCEVGYKYFTGFQLDELFSKVSLINYRKELLSFVIDINKPLEK